MAYYEYDNIIVDYYNENSFIKRDTKPINNGEILSRVKTKPGSVAYFECFSWLGGGRCPKFQEPYKPEFKNYSLIKKKKNKTLNILIIKLLRLFHLTR